MCGQWGEGGITQQQGARYIKEEMSLSALKRIIDEVSSFKPNITLFGGEPLLYQGCPEIINYIKQKGLHCLMITNGSLLEELAERIVDSGLDELNVSLDGATTLHDSIRGQPGLFDKIMRGLKALNYHKAYKRGKKPLLNLQCTISRHNYKYLEQLIDVANEAGADSLTFHHLIFLNRAILEKQKPYDRLLGCNSFDWEGFVFEAGIEAQTLFEQKKRITAKEYHFGVDFYPNFSHQNLLRYYQDNDYTPLDYPQRCLSPWIAGYIFPDGELRPCLNSGYSFGNLKKDRFWKIWNSSEALKFRSLLKEKGIFPSCVRCTELYRY